MPQMSGDLIRIYVKVKMFGPKISGLVEELLKMSGQQKKIITVHRHQFLY